MEGAGRVAVLGYTGFVGSYIAEMLPAFEGFNTANFGTLRGRSFDTVYCACLPAVKWRANAEPAADAAALEAIREVLGTVACRKFYLISTIDVHALSLPRQRERAPFRPAEEPYGRHRREFEEWALGAFAETRVIRLPALFGFGLKKNALYDLLHRNAPEKLVPADVYQWYDLRWLAGDLEWLARQPPGAVFNAYSEPVALGTVAAHFCPATLALCGGQRPPVAYDHRSDFPERWRDSAAVLRALGEFVAAFRAAGLGHGAGPRPLFAASTLHWEPADDERAAAILAKRGIRAVEVAPGQYFDWRAPRADILARCDALRAAWERRGFRVASIQGVMFGVGPRDGAGARARLALAADVAEALGASAVVFGAPDFRRAGREALAELLAAYRGPVPLCVENVGLAYGSEAAQTCAAAAVVAARATELRGPAGAAPAIAVNFDWGNAFAEADPEGAEEGPLPPAVRHTQLSAPGLGPVSSVALLPGFGRYRRPPAGVWTSLEARGGLQTLAADVFDFLSWAGREAARPKPTLVLGAGWYGCHAAATLRARGEAVALYDPAGFFAGSSARNQNRLHVGFHYPRSARTRQESARGFERFFAAYPGLSTPLRNYYFIAARSLIDFGTFCSVFRAEAAPCSRLPLADATVAPFRIAPGFFEPGSAILSVPERLIDQAAAAAQFAAALGPARVEAPPPDAAVGRVLDCTFGGVRQFPGLDPEWVFTLLVRALFEGAPIAVTVMDGPFFSLYPYIRDASGAWIYTLTHVTLGVLGRELPAAFAERERRLPPGPRAGWEGVVPAEFAPRAAEMEAAVEQAFPNYRELFAPAGYYVSKKLKVTGLTCSDRSLYVEREGRITSFAGGKITGVFAMEAEL